MSNVTATIRFKCWKQHKCSGCGCLYRYLFERSVSGTGGSPESAEAAAHNALATSIGTDADVRPCPDCGRVQPDMIAASSEKFPLFCGIAAAAVVGLIVVVGAAGGTTYANAAFAAAGVTGIAAALMFVQAAMNPNANQEANRGSTVRAVSNGTVERVSPGDPEANRPAPPLVTGGHWLGVGAVLAAAIFASSAGVAKMAGGWSANDTAPEVVGPGDTVRVYYSQQIDCVASHWTGTPTGKITDAGGLDAIPFAFFARADSWGASMSVKSSQKSTHPTLWTDIRIPDDPRLVGKTVKLHIDMPISYPQSHGSNSFDIQSGLVSRDVTLQFAPAGSASRYTTLFWAGGVAAAVALLAVGFAFFQVRKGLRDAAHPTTVEPVGTGGTGA